MKAKAHFSSNTHDEAEGDPERRGRALQRALAFLLLDTDGSPEKGVQIAALDELITARGGDLQQIRDATVHGDPVASTPTTGLGQQAAPGTSRARGTPGLSTGALQDGWTRT